MKVISYFVICLLSATYFTSCSTNKNYKTIEGTYFKKLIDIGSLYPKGEHEINRIVQNIDDQELLNYYQLLIKDNLIDKPSINILVNGKKQKWFLHKKEYNKLEPYLISKIINNNKIILKGKVYETELGFKFVENIIRIDTLNGKTLILK